MSTAQDTVSKSIISGQIKWKTQRLERVLTRVCSLLPFVGLRQDKWRQIQVPVELVEQFYPFYALKAIWPYFPAESMLTPICIISCCPSIHSSSTVYWQKVNLACQSCSIGLPWYQLKPPISIGGSTSPNVSHQALGLGLKPGQADCSWTMGTKLWPQVCNGHH